MSFRSKDRSPDSRPARRLPTLRQWHCRAITTSLTVAGQ